MQQWSHSSLLLVAHGSSRFPDSAADLMRLAERIRGKSLFERVDVAFWRQNPVLSADHLQGEQIYVLPFFAGLGKHTEQLIPERLGLKGAVTEIGRQRIIYCPPVGCHPRLPILIQQRAAAFCREQNLDPLGTALLLIGHGSKEGGASRTPETVASHLRDNAVFAEVVTVFLEQAPFARDWRSIVMTSDVIAQPLLLSAGMHASEDLPALFDGHPHVWLQRGIGSDDEIVAMMLEQIEAAS